MSVSTVFFKDASLVTQLTSMRAKFDDLQRQLATQKNSTTYGELGSTRSLDLSLKQRIGEVGTHQRTIDLVTLRMSVLDQTVGRMGEIRSEARAAIDPNNFVQQTDGSTNSQTSAKVSLIEMIALANADVGGRQLFSGKDVDTAPVVSYETMMGGTATQAGLQQVMDEYLQADLGTLENGRLTSGRAAGTVSLAEDGTHPFGYKIVEDTSGAAGLSNVTVTYNAGPPADQAFDFTGQPAVGESIKIYLDLPDGSQSVIELHVAAEAGEQNGFELGATPDDTAQNFLDALDLALGEDARTNLKAASHSRAGDRFFDTFQGNPIQRVDGGGPPPDFANATAERDGTADTVAWYVGDNSATNPRDDAIATIDQSFNISYGARANEEGIREIIQAMAVFQAADFSADSEADHGFYTAMAQRSRSELTDTDGRASAIQRLNMEMATTYVAVQRVDERHTTTQASLAGAVQDIEGVDLETVAAQVLQLQTMMEASYRATSILYNLTLADYI
ncbi:hypothetical protein [Breoghania sp. L-A4]|uniref:hypothetical protein n=1 Tax=Breoghania sp. L-A4 TaxID=2304600 RepID=UPI000E35FAA1|nr:hypothetical protein [Breoghania sp. L-A4]AXS41224.1 hypothetical protein D1F64_15825 [Breoghania sp. L-A4]